MRMLPSTNSFCDTHNFLLEAIIRQLVGTKQDSSIKTRIVPRSRDTEKRRWNTTSDVFMNLRKTLTFKACSIKSQNWPYSLSTRSVGLVNNCLVNGTHSLRIEILRMIVVRSKTNAQTCSTQPQKLSRRNCNDNPMINVRNQHEILRSEKNDRLDSKSRQSTNHTTTNHPHPQGMNRTKAYQQNRKAHVRILTTRKVGIL